MAVNSSALLRVVELRNNCFKIVCVLIKSPFQTLFLQGYGLR